MEDDEYYYGPRGTEVCPFLTLRDNVKIILFFVF